MVDAPRSGVRRRWRSERSDIWRHCRRGVDGEDRVDDRRIIVAFYSARGRRRHDGRDAADVEPVVEVTSEGQVSSPGDHRRHDMKAVRTASRPRQPSLGSNRSARLFARMSTCGTMPRAAPVHAMTPLMHQQCCAAQPPSSPTVVVGGGTMRWRKPGIAQWCRNRVRHSASVGDRNVTARSGRVYAEVPSVKVSGARRARRCHEAGVARWLGASFQRQRVVDRPLPGSTQSPGTGISRRSKAGGRLDRWG